MLDNILSVGFVHGSALLWENVLGQCGSRNTRCVIQCGYV